MADGVMTGTARRTSSGDKRMRFGSNCCSEESQSMNGNTRAMIGSHGRVGRRDSLQLIDSGPKDMIARTFRCYRPLNTDMDRDQKRLSISYGAV